MDYCEGVEVLNFSCVWFLFGLKWFDYHLVLKIRETAIDTNQQEFPWEYYGLPKSTLNFLILRTNQEADQVSCDLHKAILSILNGKFNQSVLRFYCFLNLWFSAKDSLQLLRHQAI